MIPNNSKYNNPTLSFKSIFDFINLQHILRKACFVKRSGADVESLLTTIHSSAFLGYSNIYRYFESIRGKTESLSLYEK